MDPFQACRAWSQGEVARQFTCDAPFAWNDDGHGGLCCQLTLWGEFYEFEMYQGLSPEGLHCAMLKTACYKPIDLSFHWQVLEYLNQLRVTMPVGVLSGGSFNLLSGYFDAAEQMTLNQIVCARSFDPDMAQNLVLSAVKLTFAVEGVREISDRGAGVPQAIAAYYAAETRLADCSFD